MALSDSIIHTDSSADGPNLESAASGIHWASILGGAVAAVAISLILLPLGTALGFGSFSVFTATAGSAVAFTAGMAIWLVIMQWASSGVGGYIAGRLRVKWADVHTDEVFFRDTAHGFLAWAVATIFMFALAASLTVSVVHSGAQAAAKVASSAEATGYYADSLYRTTTPAAANTTEVTTETTRILMNGAKNGAIPAADRAYLAEQVAARTGLSQAQAQARVNDTLAQIDAAATKAAQAAEAARKAAVGFFIALCISLFTGAFIASVSAALGGRLRDQ